MRAVLVVGLLLAGLLAPLADADHLQAVGSRSLSFDHRGGNEWWVEVRLGGPSAASVTGVEAMDTGGAWKALSLRSWGNWAGSFRVEPGHHVRFAAVFADGVRLESCAFTHPAGVEQCAAGPTPPPPSGFDATFRGVKGNAWWVQASVDADAPLAGVDARVDGGAWRALARQGWGAWAASFHVPDGALVDFRARATTGETDLSGLYRWPHATPVDDGGGAPPPPPGGFDATFGGVKGNAWWIETRVFADRAVAGVEARVDGGGWRPLSLRAWGAWAASFSIPEGSLVQLRARAADGSVDHAAGGWRWTAATPYPAPSATFAAAFHDVEGDAARVFVNVYASRDLAGVDVRLDEGAWQPLSRRDWGDWGAFLSIPDGSRVQFRARDAANASVVSGGYLWPGATPVEEPAAWPREGSFVAYYAEDGEHSPGGDWAAWTELNVTLRHQGGRWEVTCEGWAYEESRYREPALTRDRILVKAAFDPPRAPTRPVLGAVVAMGTLGVCGPGGFHFGEMTVDGQANVTTRKNGQAVAAPAWTAGWDPECSCMGSIASWHGPTGLTLGWWFAGRSSHQTGHLKDTDAPIAPGDPEPRPPPRPAWPREGSHAAYRVHLHEKGDHFPADSYANVTFTWRDGRWSGHCTGHRHADETPSQEGGVTPIDARLDAAPPFAPLRVQPGDLALAGAIHLCWPHLGAPVLVKGRHPEDATRDGAPVTTTAWWADETDAEDADGLDRDAWWHVGTGLLLRWEDKGGEWADATGRLVDTDAPL